MKRNRIDKIGSVPVHRKEIIGWKRMRLQNTTNPRKDKPKIFFPTVRCQTLRWRSKCCLRAMTYSKRVSLLVSWKRSKLTLKWRKHSGTKCVWEYKSNQRLPAGDGVQSKFWLALLAQINWTACDKQEIQLFNSHFEVKEIEKPKSWRLLVQSTAERADEEAVFTIQGVVVSKDLPPLREKPR